MERLLQIGLSDAVAAAVLALIVAAISQIVRRPAIAAVLWLIVLLKLLTPPIWTIPLSLPQPRPSAPAHSASSRMEPIRTASVTVTVDQRPDSPALRESRSLAVVPNQRPVLRVRRPFPFEAILASAWLAGSSVLLLIALLRIRGFQRLLRFAEPAPGDVQRRAGMLASRLDIRRPPQVSLVPGPVCPMLYSGHPPRVLLPCALWERLDADQRDALLVHELAHLRRKDHWVRRVELLVGLLYWWNPVLWLARWQLRKAEEQCCDAWVVWALPGSSHSYATALVETIDFFAGRGRPALALASTMGQFSDLKRRLVMIDQANVNRKISRGALTCVTVGAIGVLALTPVWGQSTRSQGPQSSSQTARASDTASAPALDAEMKQAIQQVRQLQRQLDRAERHVAELDARRIAGAALPPLAPAAQGKVQLVIVHYTRGMDRMLRQKLSEFNFDSVTLKHALARFHHPLPRWDWDNLVVDWRALTAAGVREDAQVRADLSGQSALFGLSEILGRAAGMAKPAIVVDWDVILITSNTQAQIYAKSDRISHEQKWDEATERIMDVRLPEVSFDQVAIADVFSFVQDVSGAKVLPDWKALEGRGITPNKPVSLHVHGVWLDQAIELIIESAGPTAPVVLKTHDGQITLTAPSGN